ncbi:hypothetical protein [Escherichia coli]|uniref:hypothetical protein n=1 Tax=Escherichia coli TaxID=562 RepID=UPI003D1F69D8
MIRFLMQWMLVAAAMFAGEAVYASGLVIPDGRAKLEFAFENAGGGTNNTSVFANVQSDTVNGVTTVRIPKTVFASGEYTNGHTETRLPSYTLLGHVADDVVHVKWLKVTREYRNRHTGESVRMTEDWTCRDATTYPDPIPSISSYTGFTYWMEGEFYVEPRESFWRNWITGAKTVFNDGWYDNVRVAVLFTDTRPYTTLALEVRPNALELTGTVGAYTNAGLVVLSTSSNTDSMVQYEFASPLGAEECEIARGGASYVDCSEMSWESRSNSADNIRVRIKSNRAGRNVVPLNITATLK